MLDLGQHRDRYAAQGNLSRVLTFQGYYYPGITDPAACAALNNGNGTYPSNRTSFFAAATW